MASRTTALGGASAGIAAGEIAPCLFGVPAPPHMALGVGLRQHGRRVVGLGVDQDELPGIARAGAACRDGASAPPRDGPAMDDQRDRQGPSHRWCAAGAPIQRAPRVRRWGSCTLSWSPVVSLRARPASRALRIAAVESPPGARARRGGGSAIRLPREKSTPGTPGSAAA